MNQNTFSQTNSFSVAELSDLTGKNLLAIYNALKGGKVKFTADKGENGRLRNTAVPRSSLPALLKVFGMEESDLKIERRGRPAKALAEKVDNRSAIDHSGEGRGFWGKDGKPTDYKTAKAMRAGCADGSRKAILLDRLMYQLDGRRTRNGDVKVVEPKEDRRKTVDHSGEGRGFWGLAGKPTSLDAAESLRASTEGGTRKALVLDRMIATFKAEFIADNEPVHVDSQVEAVL